MLYTNDFMKVFTSKFTSSVFSKLANFQLSIINFANIDNSLKIGNWKLKILEFVNKRMVGKEIFICGSSLT